MKIEEFLDALPRDILNGDDVEITEKSYREIYNFVGLDKNDTLYHLGCGNGTGLEIAQKEFHARTVGIDISAEKVAVARGKMIKDCDVICGDIRDQKIDDATVVLFWFLDQDVIEQMTARFQKMHAGCRVVTIMDPLLDFRPDKVAFPYLMYKTPLTRTASIREQILAIFGVPCIDFVTAWEHAERYTKSLGDAQNDRFLTMIQAVMIWINARNLNVACEQEMPEPIRAYISILKEFFNIEIEHLLKG